MKNRILTSLAVLCLTATGFAQQQSQPIPVDPAVKVGKLDNGLTYYIRHNEEPKGQANFYIAQQVGSILEEDHQRGLAHFLEHMCFNGTEKFPGNGVIKYCERIGVKFGQNLNAHTNIDETVYNIDNVPVGNVPSSLDSCLWILHDWSNGLLLTDEDIDHERGVIHEEWRSRSNAQLRMLDKILPVIYPNNLYGQRLPIGTMEVIDHFPYQALRDYYRKWYRPDLQAIVVVGDVDVAQVEEKIRSIFASIEAPQHPAPRNYVQVPDNEQPIVCLAKDKEMAEAVTYLYLKHDAYPVELRSDMNYLIYYYVMQAAEIMMESRMQELLERPDAPFSSAYLTDGQFFISKTKHALQGEMHCAAEDLSKATAALYREMLRVVRNGFTPSEYERAKATILAVLENDYNSRAKKSSQAYCQEYVRNFMDNEPIAGAENLFRIAQQVTEAVSVEHVNQLIRQVVPEGNLTLFCMLPDKDGVRYPSEAEVVKLLQDVAAEEIAPYQESVSDEPLLAQLPEPGHVTRIEKAALGFTKYNLSNGASVYFKHTDLDPDQVVFQASSLGGKSLYPAESCADLKALNEVMNIGGLGAFSRSQLGKVLAGKRLSLTPNVDLYTESIKGNSTVKDLETLLQLNYLYFTDQRMDNEAFDSWLNRARASLANQQSDPMTAFKDSIFTSIFSDKNRVAPLELADLDQLNYLGIMSIARQRFSNAADFNFVLTGAVDEETLLPLIERYIGSLPANAHREQPDLTAMDFKKGRQTNTFERAMEIPQVTNYFVDYMNARYTLKNDLAFRLALNALSVELMEEIREKEGGTYGISANGVWNHTPSGRQQAVMEILYQTNPEKYEYLNQRVRDILQKFTQEGPSEENLAKGKEFLQKNFIANQQKNAYWADALIQLLDGGVDLTTPYEATLSSLTRDDLRKVMHKLLKAGNHGEVIQVGTPVQ